MQSRTLVSACAVFLSFLAVPMTAQFRAGIQGTISDSSGAVIPGASVTLTNKETQKKQSTTSSGEGFYRFNGLPPGSYSISASKPEFQTISLDNVTVSGDDVQGANLTMQPGAMTQSVTVQGDSARPSRPRTGMSMYGSTRRRSGICRRLGAILTICCAWRRESSAMRRGPAVDRRSLCRTATGPAVRIRPFFRPRTRCQLSPTGSVFRRMTFRWMASA